MDGILNIDKPAGWTSFDVVALVRKLTKVRRVGHGGTLDPMATGVLPVFIGQATRLVEYLAEARKRYVAKVRLGITTNTYDSEGTVVSTADPSRLTLEDIQEASMAFTGLIMQTPPPFSAVKHKGRPLYSYARAGAPLPEVQPREATIYELTLFDFKPPYLTLEVECGSGTYIRTLAHDLGSRLGCGAHLTSLMRTQVGDFVLADTISVERTRSLCKSDHLESVLLHPDTVLCHWPAAVLAETSEASLRYGQELPLAANAAEGTWCRAYSSAGDFVGIVRYSDGHFRPAKVFGKSLQEEKFS